MFILVNFPNCCMIQRMFGFLDIKNQNLRRYPSQSCEKYYNNNKNNKKKTGGAGAKIFSFLCSCVY